MLLAALAGAVLATSCSIETKDFDALFGDDFSVDTLETAQSSRVYDRNGILITELRGEQNRTDIRYDQMPEVLINAVVAIADQVPYCVSKGGVNQLTKVMALALAPHGIRVNAIGPGSIMTDMLAAVNSDPGAKQKMLSRTPAGRIGEPSEIAGVAAFLASDDAAYVTGQTVYADGGRLPLNYTVEVGEPG